MDLIHSPPSRNVMVRGGQLHAAETLSELGIYGVWLSRRGGAGGGDEVLMNECAGHLMRTKAATSMEGGVAAGFAVLDSPLLVADD